MGKYILKPVVFNTKNDADGFLANVRTLFEEYGHVTVADVYDLKGLTTIHIDHQYGWVTKDQIDSFCFDTTDGCYDLVYPTPHDIRSAIGDNHTGEKTIEEVTHPNHYQSATGLEAWDVIEAFTSDLKGVEAFDTGNVLKYMCRWKKKNGLKDLEKAKFYIEHLIDHVKNPKKEND